MKIIKRSLLIVIFYFLYTEVSSQSLGPQPAAYHTVGLHIDGTVYIWGRNNSGQLGINTISDRQPTPVKVLKGAYSGTTYLGDNPANKITAVALGLFHSTALAEDGLVYTWGVNDLGQLGINNTDRQEVPVKVLSGAYDGTYTYLGEDPDNKITAVALGWKHSCALAADGTVFTWGHNNWGQLGDSTNTDQWTPVKVWSGEYSDTYTYLGEDPSNPIIAVALGFYHSAALAADGTVFTWGRNLNGQLGNGDYYNTDQWTPVKVLSGDYSGSYTYLGEDPSNPITAIAIGGYHGIALAEDGTVYTWGHNSYGELGIDETGHRNTPVQVFSGEYSGGSYTYLGEDPDNKITSIALGWMHSCATDADGMVYTWGLNVNGQLGIDNTDNQWTPVKVLMGEYDGTTYLGDNSTNRITSVSLGYSHSVALASDATVYTWGHNGYGQLGDNTTSQRNTPIKVHGVDNVGDLALPVELTSFNSIVSNGQVTLEWITESEIENEAFILEKSIDSVNFYQIAELAGQGNSSSQYIYTFIDEDVLPERNYFYRISDRDYAGRITILKTISVNTGQFITENFVLHPNYPNPFNSRTKIVFELKAFEEGQNKVEINIYNALGQRITKLLNKNLDSGVYEEYWDGTNDSGKILSSGVYILELKIGSLSKMQKMILMR
jgi:alpha-tubulin suppressor-like RCC1 family protein